jgi:hypothetical protein
MPDLNPVTEQDVRSTLTQGSLASAAPAAAEATHTPSEPMIDSTASAQTQSQAAAPPSFSFLEYARSQGFDLGENVGDDQTAADAFLGNWRQMQSYLAQQQMQAQPPAPEVEKPKEDEWSLESHFAKHWGVPKRDPAWDDVIASGVIVKDPDTGRYVPRPGINSWMQVNPNVLNAINDYEAAYARNAREYLQNPIQRTYDALIDAFDRRYARPEAIDTRLESQQVEAAAARFESENAEWLKTQDGGKFLRLVSAFRATMPPMQAMQEALAYVSPPSKAAAAPTAQPTQAAAAPVAPTPEQISAQKQESFLQDAKRKASHSQSGGGSPPAPEDTGPMSGDEVRSLLKRTHRAAMAAGR